VLLPLEDSCRQNYTERQIDFWVEWFTTGCWTRMDILAAHRFLLAECKFLPSAADWTRVRPSQRGTFVTPDESLEDTTERLALSAPTSWARFVMAETTKGLRRSDMPAAYDRIIAEGERRKIDPAEIAAFRQAKVKTLEGRAGRIQAERDAKEAEANRKRATRAAIQRAVKV
jgi:hypothetical protein